MQTRCQNPPSAADDLFAKFYQMDHNNLLLRFSTIDADKKGFFFNKHGNVFDGWLIAVCDLFRFDKI